ncbi:hypothetical protein AALP_AA5G222300 [Arabis alpina]|uniref:Protein kinase domain-containing protein n=1 Tax=Arabis alpina TaxID=50452 RepID=A0A087GYQ7_ARAAL|nr:hypothetical protein AALP_AA5G222300 [Arabis alpina]
MDWWKKKKSLTVVQKQSLARGLERGAMLTEDLIECCDGKSNPIKFFSPSQIFKATENLCKSSIVSEFYDYERWYSGTLDNQRMILVKKSWRAQPSNPEGFCSEVRDIAISSMVSGHKNFMKLVGCCLETEIPFMVYYVGKKQYSRIDLVTILSWKRRMKIAEEIATALAYLHTAFSRPFLYCNMDIRNILLDEDGVAKLIDFSNCVSIPHGETFVKLGYVRGAYDYIDDDYMTTGLVSEITDAFAFGILMQKLLTGEEVFRHLYGRKDWKNLAKRKFPRWLSKSLGEERMNEIVDPKMLEKMGGVSEEERCRMEAFLILSERCIRLRGEVPKMVQVAKELKRLRKDLTSSSFSSGETQIGPAQRHF